MIYSDQNDNYEDVIDDPIAAANQAITNIQTPQKIGFNVKPIDINKIAQSGSEIMRATIANQKNTKSTITGEEKENLAAKRKEKAANWLDATSNIYNSAAYSATGFDKNDAVGTTMNAASKFASNFGFWGKVASAAIQVSDATSLLTGKKVDGLNGNTGSSSFADFSVEGKKFRQSFVPWGAAFKNNAANVYNERLKRQEEMFGAAKNLLEEQKKKKAAALNNINDVNANNQQQLQGHNDYSTVLAKEGAKIEYKTDLTPIMEALDFLILKDIENTQEITQFENGGSVIPTGALHKNKHHLEETNEDLKGQITSKGIPVISEENGEIIQHAEVEKEEIILELSLSKKIEKLWKEGTEEAMIKAGKLLAEEIMTDTTDNAGLIDKIAE